MLITEHTDFEQK